MLSKLRSALVYTFAACFGHALLHAQSFSNPYRIPTTSDPYSVTVADFNGDGRPDIAWLDISTTPNQMHVLLAQANGSFLPASTLLTFPSVAITRSPNCLAADFNQDGHQDLVCSQAAQFAMSVLVFLGNGDGTFQPPISTVVPTASNGAWVVPLIFLAGDLNGDGFTDLIIEEAQSQDTQVLLGDNKGGFRAGIPIHAGFNYPVPVIADVNGDGKPDILWPDGPEVELGNGDGSFGPLMNYSETSYYAATCTFHDMDGDGHLDAVCGYPETNNGDITGATDLIILHGNPDGSFNTTPISDKTFGDKNNQYDGFGTFQFPLAVADLNGDGISDVIGSSGDGLAVLLGGKGLSFRTPLHYAEAFAGVGGGVDALYQSQIVDMNGDVIPDIVAAGPNGVYVTYGKKDGTFISAFAPEVTEVIGYATVADFNGDGIPDIAATGDTEIKLSLGKGDGTFLSPTPIPNTGIDFSSLAAHIVHGDFNGDGKQDLMALGPVSSPYYGSYIFFGHGDGTFASPVPVPNSSNLYPMYEQLTDSAVFDINHDGRSDLLSSSTTTGPNAPAQIYFALSNGDGSFNTVTTNVPADLQSGGYPFITFPTLADFNRDGKLDAAYGSITNAYVVNGHGDGTFDTTSTALPIPIISGTASQEAVAVASGDFDGDGNQDFVVLAQYGAGQYPYASPLATAAWVFYGNGNGTFAAPVLAGTFDRNYTGIAAADLNGDGLADIVLKTSGSLGGGNAVGIIDSQAGRTFGPEVNYTAGTGLSSMAIADLNRDGRPDLIFANGDYNVRASSVTVLLNQGNAPGGGAGNGATTTTALTCNPATIAIGGTSLLSAMVTSSGGTPTGSITFTDSGVSLGQPTLTNGDASLTYTGQVAGTHDIVATFMPTGSFASSSASCTVVVDTLPSTAILTVVPPSSTFGNPVTLTATVSATNPPGPSVPTGSVTFTYTTSTNPTSVLLGTVNLTAGVATFVTTILPVGEDNLNCTYSGDSVYSPAVCMSQPLSGTGSAITLTSSLNPAPALTAITFTAQIAAGSGGTIVFGINGQNFTTTPNAAGTSTYTISTLTAGSYPITATWFASGNALAAQASLTQVVTAPVAVPDFSFNGTNLTFATRHSGTGDLELVSLNGFSGNVAITCNPPYPPEYTCTVQQPSVSLSPGLSVVFTFTLSPSYTAGVNARSRSNQIVLAVFLPVSLFSLIGLARKRRATLRALLLTSVLAILGSFTTACGPDHFIPITTGIYPITFTATGTSQGSTTPITHTLTLSADITP
jgi:hypothetical protein